MTRDYWADRTARTPSQPAVRTNTFVQWLLSSRLAGESFLRRVVEGTGQSVVLDVGCGAGKPQLVRSAAVVYGVDIPGYPAAAARELGYSATLEYTPPAFAFDLPQRVDLAVSINLNAHVDRSTLFRIFDSALTHLLPGGKLVIIGEFDNKGFGYRLMKFSPARFRAYVSGMHHWHLELESAFTGAFASAYPHLRIVKREKLVVMPPLHHFVAWRFGKSISGRPQRTLALATDVLLSAVNNILRHLPGRDDAFLVGLVYESLANPGTGDIANRR